MRNETIREIEQFLYREARLLDERKFHDWLDLLDRRYSLLDAGPVQPLPGYQQSDLHS